MYFRTTFYCIASFCVLAAGSPLDHAKRNDATISTQMAATSTTSSSTACPTTPEEGTYCGFINPEDPCAPQPGGYGPKMSPDTVSTFQQYTPFQSMSLNSTYTPGYTTIFTNLPAASKTNTYIGLYLLQTYDVSACAAKCNEVSSCNSFNLYIERDPSVNPTKNDSTAPTVWGYFCPDPASMTNFKCALWGDGIYNSTATNVGQTREDFEVVIVGSNAFVKNAYFNTTTYQSGPPVPSTSSSKGPSSVSGIAQYTGAASAGVTAQWSVWSVSALGLAVMLAL